MKIDPKEVISSSLYKLGGRHLDFDYRAFSDCPQTKAQKTITGLKHKAAIQKALEMIEARIQNPPSLDELASFTGLSRTYFSYVFKEVMGMRLQDYLVQTRLNKAKDLLSDFNLEIKQIARKVGFRDPNHFCRTFKKKVGVSPTDWRLREIKNPPSQES